MDAEDFALQDGEVRGTRNLIPDVSGQGLVTRPSLRYLSTLYTGTGLYPQGLDFTSLEVQDLVIMGGRTRAGESKVVVTDGVTTVVKSFGFQNWRPTITSLAGKTFIFNGRGEGGVQGFVVQRTEVGSNWEVVDFVAGGDGNTSYSPYLGTTWQNRLVLANFGKGRENMVIVSDMSNPTLFPDQVFDPTGGLNRVINSIDGDELTCVRETFLTGTGTPSQSALLLLKRYSAYLAVGRWPLSTDLDIDPLALQIQRISANAGCASHQTFQVTKYGVIWCGPDDVWFMPYGGQPIPVGRKIRSRLKNTPTNLQFAWHASYHEDIYRLAIYGEGVQDGLVVDDDFPLSSTNGYMACDEQWWLDFRHGPPTNWQEARWFGPQVYRSISRSSAPLSDLETDATNYERQIVGTYCMGKNPKLQDSPLMAVGVQLDVSSSPVPFYNTLCVMDGKASVDVMGTAIEAGSWVWGEYWEKGTIILAPTAVSPGFEDATNNYRAWRCTTAGFGGSTASSRPDFDVSPQTDNGAVWTLITNSVQNITALDLVPEVAIPVELLTGSIHGGDLMTDKLFIGTELSSKATTPTTVTTEFDEDYGTLLSSSDVTERGSSMIMGSAVLGTTIFSDPPSTIPIYLDGSSRPVAKSMAMKLSSSGGKTITVTAATTLQVVVITPASDFLYPFVVIPAGTYTPLELWTYFVTQFNIAYNNLAQGFVEMTQCEALHGAVVDMGAFPTACAWAPNADINTVGTEALRALAIWKSLGWGDTQFFWDPGESSSAGTLYNNYPESPVAGYYENDLKIRQLNLIVRPFKRRP